MHGIAFVLYVVASCAIAWFLAKVLTRRAKETWPRWVVAGVLSPIVFFLPLADEIVGRYQFERLCAQAKEVKFYGTIPVGEELYTPEGKWRYGLLMEMEVEQRSKEGFRLQKIIDSYLRRESSPTIPQEIPAAILIQVYERKIYDAKTGRLLAEWRHYGAYGGWFGRTVVAGEVPLIVRPQCMPEAVWKGHHIQAVFKFAGSSEANK